MRFNGPPSHHHGRSYVFAGLHWTVMDFHDRFMGCLGENIGYPWHGYTMAMAVPTALTWNIIMATP